ncbi:MAG: BCD family MFS transporter [Myxococcota bacterium]
MSRPRFSQIWQELGTRYLPFADAASPELPLRQLLRLSLFQVSVGMALVLLNGTLNRVMIIELGIPTWVVATMISLPLLFAPFRALVGHRSDNHRSAIGWRRAPYILLGTMIQFGGLAIMPFSLLLLSGDGLWAPPLAGEISAALAFFVVGVGLHTTQTAGLALATDLAPEASRPRVVALLYVTLLLGMVASALIFGLLLQDFTPKRLIQVIQGAAVVTFGLNVFAVWKQEARRPEVTSADRPRESFQTSWSRFVQGGQASRLLVVVGLGTAGFNMQDVLLEPYGGEVLALSVSATTSLTALLALGTLLGFALAARSLTRGNDPHRLAALGALVGVSAFSAVIFSGAFETTLLFATGTFFIGMGGGLFSVGTLTAAMGLSEEGTSGLALGAWGAVQATAAGLGIAVGGALRDVVSDLAGRGLLGPGLSEPSAGYIAVYHLEIGLLFATLVAVGPLVRNVARDPKGSKKQFGLAELPG